MKARKFEKSFICGVRLTGLRYEFVKMQRKESDKIKKLTAFYNMAVNMFWSVLNLVPISVFCYEIMSLRLFYILLFTTLLTLLLPKKFFNNIQIGKTALVYEKLGVKFINKFTQNGSIVNRLVRRKFPQHKIVSNTTRSAHKLLQQTYMFEKFHFAMFVFFTIAAVYAFTLKHVWWGIIISVSNVIYNVYPNLLQQYVRIRLAPLLDR